MVAALGSMPADDENGWVVIAALRMFGSRARTVDAPVKAGIMLRESFRVFLLFLHSSYCITMYYIVLLYYHIRFIYA